MTFAAFLLIFASVFLHAAWNIISKSKRPSLAFYTLMTTTAALVWLPFFIVSAWDFSRLPPAFFFFLFLSIAAEIIYVGGLAYGYRKGDISMVYPLVRALPVLMIAFITVAFDIGKRPAATALAGMLVIIVGCIVLPLNRFREITISRYCNKLTVFVVVAALGTTAYTLIDSHIILMLRETFARETILDTLSFLFLLESGLAVGLGIMVALIPEERKTFREIFFHSWYPSLAGTCSSCAYALILLAMTQVTNVSYIQAFRQMSLPLGFFAGIFLLKEPLSSPKIAGLFAIVIGLVMVAIG